MKRDFLVSIITINYNNYDGLSATMNSVINQDYSNIQYIVIDGGSNDGSVELIKEYSDRLYYWVSENDKGIFHAQNKGVSIATGDFILILNSGDSLVKNDSVSSVVKYLDEGIQIAACDLFFSDRGRKYKKVSPESVSVSYFLNHVLYHPGLLVSKEVYKKYGLYDESLKLTADWEFCMRTAGIAGCSYKHIPVVLSIFDMSGISSQQSTSKDQEIERQSVLKKYFPETVSKELRVLQDILDERGISLVNQMEKQLLQFDAFTILKSEIRNKPRLSLFMKIIFSKLNLYQKKIALKMLIRTLWRKKKVIS
ncbi:MAG TPA: glycosyltransferase family 2 protein [Saprospiraceae bacterium]|nr:glycosyltransferase family 2 protein [Lacibacter sp.]HMO89981.1 glycosyltransferase family 2 protein [Lacibacter sp.]HMQ08620.1 glycosyltransferase family 2 protein [Saprospiraceae bacterium]